VDQSSLSSDIIRGEKLFGFLEDRNLAKNEEMSQRGHGEMPLFVFWSAPACRRFSESRFAFTRDENADKPAHSKKRKALLPAS